MSKKPEGLSPCYFSLASPDIPTSHVFRWTWAGQTSATIRIYNSIKTLLHSYSVASDAQSVAMGSVGYTFASDTTYYWTVQAQNSEESVMAKFKYDTAPKNPQITWASSYPQGGDVVVKSSKFQEIKSNLGTLLNNYTDVPTSIKAEVDRLFSGNIVPSRKDFNSLQRLIQFIGVREGIKYHTKKVDGSTTTYEVILEPAPERYYDSTNPSFTPFATLTNPEPRPKNLDVLSWVSGSLGASDINKVIAYVDYLTKIPPKPAANIGFDVPSSTMYSMTGISAVSDGKTDATIDASWSSGDVTSTTARIKFNEMSSSKDVWFYECEFAYGPNGIYKSRLFLRPEDIIDVSGLPERLFDINWGGLYTKDNISTARLEFKIVTVDNYGNISPLNSFTKAFSSNMQVPLGVSHYVLEVQRTSLTSTSYVTSGTWYEKYKGSNISSTYSLTGGEGKIWHRAKVIDKSGMESGWIYASTAIIFDPLTAPAKPGNFRVTSTTTSSISLAWNSSDRAESYEVYRWITPGTQIYTGTGLTKTDTGLNAGSSYNYYVRAVNRVGVSDWVGLTGTTQKAEQTKTWNSIHSHSWRDNWGWRADQGVNHTYVYQGEWENYGNHKGLWYFDDANIRSTLAGKEILEVWIECERIKGGYSTANSARFWTHNRPRESWEDNHSAGPGTLSSPGVSGGSHNHNYLFSRYEKQWVPLPKGYGEWLRDNKATGIAIYEQDGKPYMRFDNNARLYIKYK